MFPVRWYVRWGGLWGAGVSRALEWAEAFECLRQLQGIGMETRVFPCEE